MPLTPADVHNVAFSKPPVGKRGYNEDEVDAFLDLVEAELTRLIEENSGADSDGTRARHLAVAQGAADRLIETARVEANKILSDAQDRADVMLTDSLERAETRLREAQEEADALRTDAEVKQSEVAATIDEQRRVLQGRLEKLRAFENEYRARLKSYLETQLQELPPTVPALSRSELEGSIEQLQEFDRNFRERLKDYLQSQIAELGETTSAKEPPFDAPQKVSAKDGIDGGPGPLPGSAPADTAESPHDHPPKAGTKAKRSDVVTSDTEGSNSPVPPAGVTSVEASGVFISYRRDDERSFAGRLYDRLLSRFGEHEIFMDVDSIELGLDFTDVIEERLSQCSVVLVVMGNRWLDCADRDGGRRLDNPDDFVRLEIETALAREGVRVIPVLVDDAVLPRASDLPPSLCKLVRRNAIRMSHEGFGGDFGRLISTLQKVMAS